MVHVQPVLFGLSSLGAPGQPDGLFALPDTPAAPATCSQLAKVAPVPVRHSTSGTRRQAHLLFRDRCRCLDRAWSRSQPRTRRRQVAHFGRSWQEAWCEPRNESCAKLVGHHNRRPTAIPLVREMFPDTTAAASACGASRAAANCSLLLSPANPSMPPLLIATCRNLHPASISASATGAPCSRGSS